MELVLTPADLEHETPCVEPPRVERVLTPAELEREILYAGGGTL